MYIKILVIISILFFLGCGGDSELFGTLTEDTAIYTTDSSYTDMMMKKGTRVRLWMKEKDSCKQNKYDEKLVYIMFPNQYGDFVNGKKACIPLSKIKWD